MRFLPFSLIAASLFGQQPDAAGLLRETAAVAASASSWHVEGTIRYFGTSPTPTARFKLWTGEPERTRYEQTGGTTPATIVCDGADIWVYSPPLRRHGKANDDSRLCLPIVGEWRRLGEDVISPELAGRCGPDQASESAMHVLVRGHTDPALASVGRIKRELCIDESRKTVVWETWESKYGKQLFTYSKTDPAAAATGGIFEFKPPSGSALTEFSLPVPRPLGVMSAATARGVTPPKLVHKTEPAYGKESRRKRIEGTVVLWAPIGKDGVPVEIAIYRSLTRDLDAEAMKAVRKWRFTPAMKDGQPIATRVTIDVNFRLLRPAKK